jgi:hypothetical protein
MPSSEELEDEAKSLGELLCGKTVKIVRRHRPTEVMIEFDDGTRLFVDAIPDGLDFSVT